MALIGKLRERKWLLPAVMVLAIGGFIFMEIMTMANKGGSGVVTDTVVGSIAGKELDFNDVKLKEETIYAQSKSSDPYGVKNAIWNGFVEEALVASEAEAIGLGVSKDELRALEFGPNYSRIIESLLQQRQIDTSVLNAIKRSVDQNTALPNGVNVILWREYEKLVINDQLRSKLNNLVEKGIYTPTWQTEVAVAEGANPIDFEFVKVGFDFIKDDDVKLTDADYQSFIKENSQRYTFEEETRKIQYLTFEVAPSVEDSVALKEKVDKLLAGVATATNDSIYFTNNGGVINPIYQKVADMSPAVQPLVKGAAKGSIINTFVDGNTFVAGKVIDVRAVPDSVRSRHILIGAKTAQELPAIQKTMDSLKLALETGKASWDSLNAKYNEDTNAKMRGGDLGAVAQGVMVPEFNNLIFLQAQQGKYYTVTTQYGIHLVQVTGVVNGDNAPKYKMAYLGEQIIPSEATSRKAEDAANAILNNAKTMDALTTEAKKANMAIQTSTPFRANDYVLGILGSGDAQRAIVKWAFEKGKVGAIAPQTFNLQDQQANYTNRYVIAALKSIQPKGLASVEAIKDDITPLVRNKKKGEMLATKINSQDLTALATQYNSKVDTARNITFSTQFAQNLGSEPKVIGTAFNTALNGVSKPIAGETGVFVLKVVKKETNPNPMDKAILKNQLSMGIKNQVKGRLVAALKKHTTIKDYRTKFF